MPNVAKVSGCRDGLFFHKRSNGVPNAGGVKHPPYGSGEEGQEIGVGVHSGASPQLLGFGTGVLLLLGQLC